MPEKWRVLVGSKPAPAAHCAALVGRVAETHLFTSSQRAWNIRCVAGSKAVWRKYQRMVGFRFSWWGGPSVRGRAADRSAEARHPSEPTCAPEEMISALSDSELAVRISDTRAAQTRNPPNTQAWRDASATLRQLFAEAGQRWRQTRGLKSIRRDDFSP